MSQAGESAAEVKPTTEAGTLALQSLTAAHIEAIAPDDHVALTDDSQAVLAHVRGLEASFMSVVGRLGSSPALNHAMASMATARQWIVTHLTT